MVMLLLIFHSIFVFTKVDMLAQQESYVCPLVIYAPGSYRQPHWELPGTLPKTSILQSKAIFSSWTRGNSVSARVWFGPSVMSSLENTLYLHGDFITPYGQCSQNAHRNSCSGTYLHDHGICRFCVLKNPHLTVYVGRFSFCLWGQLITLGYKQLQDPVCAKLCPDLVMASLRWDWHTGRLRKMSYFKRNRRNAPSFLYRFYVWWQLLKSLSRLSPGWWYLAGMAW